MEALTYAAAEKMLLAEIPMEPNLGFIYKIESDFYYTDSYILEAKLYIAYKGEPSDTLTLRPSFPFDKDKGVKKNIRISKAKDFAETVTLVIGRNPQVKSLVLKYCMNPNCNHKDDKELLFKVFDVKIRTRALGATKKSSIFQLEFSLPKKNIHFFTPVTCTFLKRDKLGRIRIWPKIRLLWVTKKKNQEKDCTLAQLPWDIIRLIASQLVDSPLSDKKRRKELMEGDGKMLKKNKVN